MGLIDKIKQANIERAEKQRAEAERKEIESHNSLLMRSYNNQLENWNANTSVIEALVAVFESACSGKDAVSNQAVLKKGEFALWSGVASLHEARKLPGQYVGRSSGFSVPTPIKGVRFRTGATKGTFIPGNEVQQIVDRGSVLLTTHRLLFSGNLKSQEWAFSKWTGAEVNEDETNYMFHVSNRQKASGIILSLSDGFKFNRFIAQVLDAQRDGIEAVLAKLKAGRDEYLLEKPVKPALRELPTPSPEN